MTKKVEVEVEVEVKVEQQDGSEIRPRASAST